MATEYMPLAELLASYRDGDERGWPQEFAWLWTHQTIQMMRLVRGIISEPIREPIQLGYDGRVWDGHHRLAAASALGLLAVPVERIPNPEPNVAACPTCGHVGGDPR